MDKLKLLLSTAIGRKLLMGVTGLAMIGFLISHALGNLLMFSGPEAYNHYGHALTSNPLIYLAEAGLIALFVSHFVTGLALTRRNRAARPAAYQVSAGAGAPSRKSLASSTMIISGIILLIFVPLHIATFKFGAWYETADGSMRDLHRLVVEEFANPGMIAWYAIALLFMGFHAFHGFGSAFESLGNDASRNGLRRVGQLLAVALTLAFLSVPVAIALGGGAL
jgi:succinate dehydrogenase / fumarate reductase cytochrome b subunit